MSYENKPGSPPPPTYQQAPQMAEVAQPHPQYAAPQQTFVQPQGQYEDASAKGGYYSPSAQPMGQPIGQEHTTSNGYFAGQQQQYAPQQHAQQPQQGMHPVQSPGQQPVAPVQTQTSQHYQNVTPIHALGSGPSPVQCPSCGQRAMTRVDFQAGNTTHAWALGLFLTTCCCCIPYFVSGTKDVEHKCGNCGVRIATWHRSGRTEQHAYN